MKNKDIYNLYQGLYEISQDKELKFNVKISYMFAKDKNILEPYYNAIIETREKILEKYGSPKDDGNWHVSKDKMDAFISEWDSFMDIDNFISLGKVKIEDLEGERIGVELMEKLLSIIEKA